MTTTNPYEAPTSSVGPPVSQRLVVGRAQVIWLLLYGTNLVAPLVFASEILEKTPRGKVGMAWAILVLALMGVVALNLFPRIRPSALIGATIVAASQLMPILQIFAGMFAITFAQWLSSPADSQNLPAIPRDLSMLGGFVATLTTGFELIAVSLVLGWTLHRSWLWFHAADPRLPPPFLSTDLT